MSGAIHTRHTSAEVRRLIAGLVAALAGRTGDYATMVRGIKIRIGLVALRCVQQAFLAKSAGGAGDDGISWAPLKRATIAARAVGPGSTSMLAEHGISKRSKGLGARRQGAGDLDKRGRLKRGFLTAGEDKRWRQIFAAKKAMFEGTFGLSDAAASARAAQVAWTILKASGAKTRLEILGSRVVATMRDSGRLFNSLSPGTEDPAHWALGAPAPAAPIPEDRKLEVGSAGVVIVGSNCDYAGAQHARRPLWPATGLPEPWASQIEECVRDSIIEAAALLVTGEGRAA